MNSQNLYSDIAGLYDIGLWLNGYKGAVNYIVDQLPFRTTDTFRVLDAGCGTGLYSIAILKKFPNAQIVAFDLNKKMVERMKANLKRNNFEKRATVFVRDVLESAPQNEQGFDLVITGGVLEYVNTKQGVQNLAGYLRKGGYFLNSLVQDNWLATLIASWYGFKPHSAEENISAFKQNDFELQKVIKIPFRFFPISLIKEVHLFQKFP